MGLWDGGVWRVVAVIGNATCAIVGRIVINGTVARDGGTGMLGGAGMFGGCWILGLGLLTTGNYTLPITCKQLIYITPTYLLVHQPHQYTPLPYLYVPLLPPCCHWLARSSQNTHKSTQI